MVLYCIKLPFGRLLGRLSGSARRVIMFATLLLCGLVLVAKGLWFDTRHAFVLCIAGAFMFLVGLYHLSDLWENGSNPERQKKGEAKPSQE